MRKLILILTLMGVSRSAEAVVIQASMTAVRLDEDTVRLQVSNVALFPEADLYTLFHVPTVSPFGDPVYLGAYGDPVSVLQGEFGLPSGYTGDVHVIGPGETLAFGHEYSIDVLSPPWEGQVSLDLHAAQEFFYEYPLPSGDVFRDLLGTLEGDLRFTGYLPAGIGDRTELFVVAEPRALSLWGGTVLFLALAALPVRRRSTS